jgi:hypothetical protein
LDGPGWDSEGTEVVNWIGFEPGGNVSVRLSSVLLNPSAGPDSVFFAGSRSDLEFGFGIWNWEFEIWKIASCPCLSVRVV